jgi:hypothetical protein
VEQPLSCSVLEDTRACAPMEIMMTGSPEDICLFACSLQSLSSGHVAAPELPELEGGYRSRELPSEEVRAVVILT